jgi:hypothetical protein
VNINSKLHYSRLTVFIYYLSLNIEWLDIELKKKKNQ